jgi:hypothetical protein
MTLEEAIAQAIRVADGNHTLGAGELGEVAANAVRQWASEAIQWEHQQLRAERDDLRARAEKAEAEAKLWKDRFTKVYACGIAIDADIDARIAKVYEQIESGEIESVPHEEVVARLRQALEEPEQ